MLRAYPHGSRRRRACSASRQARRSRGNRSITRRARGLVARKLDDVGRWWFVAGHRVVADGRTSPSSLSSRAAGSSCVRARDRGTNEGVAVVGPASVTTGPALWVHVNASASPSASVAVPASEIVPPTRLGRSAPTVATGAVFGASTGASRKTGASGRLLTPPSSPHAATTHRRPTPNALVCTTTSFDEKAATLTEPCLMHAWIVGRSWR